MLFVVLFANSCKSNIPSSYEYDKKELLITNAKYEGFQEYTPTKIEWILLQATVYATPKRLLKREFKNGGSWSNNYLITYKKGENCNTVIVDIEYTLPPQKLNFEKFQFELEGLKGQAEIFLKQKAKLMHFNSLKIKIKSQ
jgi:hypothetical protein